MNLLRKLLVLDAEDPRRVGAFFGLYFLLFATLTIADGLSLSLFVQRVGAAALPRYYALIAVLNLVLVGVYVRYAERRSSLRVLLYITGGCAASFALTWAGITLFGGNGLWYGFLFATREVSYTLFLMHFGTYLQDYFTRAEMIRVMPLVYAGGRVGGILGGFLLSTFGGLVGLESFLLVCAVGALVAVGWAAMLSRGFQPVRSSADEVPDVGVHPGKLRSLEELEAEARGSFGGFLRFVRDSPLMYWNTVTAVVYMVCRWILNFQYSTFFEGHFSSDVAMAEFLGLYTQAALVISLVFQLFVVNRLVLFVGLKGAQMTYAALLAAGLLFNSVGMTLGTAVFSRFVETELRFGLRNPLNQLIINKFSKGLRVRIRAFSIGLLIPVSTLLTSALLTGLVSFSLTPLIAGVGGIFGLGYLFGSARLNATYDEERRGART